MKTQTGLTLVELMVTITIASILLAVAVPGFQTFFAHARLGTAASDLAVALNFARSEAIRRGAAVSLRNTSGGVNWEGGWTMFQDTDRDGTQDAGEETLRTGRALDSGITLRSSASYSNFMMFLPNGRSNAAGHFAVCKDGSTTDAKTYVVGATGRLRPGLDSNGDHIPELDGTSNLTSCSAP